MQVAAREDLLMGSLNKAKVNEFKQKRPHECRFTRHRGLAGLGLLLAIVAFIIALSELGSDIKDPKRRAHKCATC
jgi:hypothetical protein